MSNITVSIKQLRYVDKRFLVLILTVAVSGFSQGLLLPLLSVLLEKSGVSSSLNGLSAAALYLGMLIATPLMEKPVRKFGYKPVILFGLGLIIVAVSLFPIWVNYYFWILLRFLVGIGDSALHFASQVWITSTVDSKNRGRSISIYGLSYGIGFGIGPLGLLLLRYGNWVPFAVAVTLFLFILIPILKLDNEKPEEIQESVKEKRYIKVYALAGIALMPMFIFGLLESTLNNSFPIYGLRVGLSEANVSILLSSFVIGSLIFQLPLGIISDKVGRRKVLIIITLLGGLLFMLVPSVSDTKMLFVIFVLAGGLLGSLFSLGLAYVADLVPVVLLPTANIIASIHFGIGSMIGPYFSGTLISTVSPDSLFYFLSISILTFTFLAILSSVRKKLNYKEAAEHSIQ